LSGLLLPFSDDYNSHICGIFERVKIVLVAFDIGNTNIHMGLWDKNAWRLSWRARTVSDKMPDEYGVLVRNFLSSADVGKEAITGAVIGSVVPPLTLSFHELVTRYFQLEPVNVSGKIDIGIPIEIDQPEQAGADRLANSAAVVALHGGGPAIVVDFGTATNFDVVSANDAYIGGAIAPGIGAAHDSLVSRAARLHKIDIEPPPDAIGRNTIHAMQAGVFLGYVGLVEGIVSRIKASLKSDQVKVIGTGGLASLFIQHTPVIDTVAPELTLDGLRVIYDYVQKQKTK
jgi:type III pantothenate kinase